MHPKTFVEQRNILRAEIDRLVARITLLEEEAAAHPLPTYLRPAVATDILVDAVLWYPEVDGKQWVVVDEVRRPNDAFKAYESDGCRYGLEGAFVEV